VAKKKKASTGAARPDEPFEVALQRLEQIVHQLEEGELSLSQSLALYEEGVEKLARCRQRLAEAEERIEQLVGVDDEGHAETRLLDDESMTLEEKQSGRSRRRSYRE